VQETSLQFGCQMAHKRRYATKKRTVGFALGTTETV
jgi:hypothetical protein